MEGANEDWIADHGDEGGGGVLVVRVSFVLLRRLSRKHLNRVASSV
jgi:hypothetical protein